VAQRNPSGGAGFFTSAAKVFRFIVWGGSMLALILSQSGIALSSAFSRWSASIALIFTSWWVWQAEHKKVVEYETPQLRIAFAGTMGVPWGSSRIHYHLKVENCARVPAENCRVNIIKIVKLVDGKWVDQRAQRSMLTWHSTNCAQEQTVNDEHDFDLGHLDRDDKLFRPAYALTSLGFGELTNGDTLRYYISAAGKSAYMEKPFVIEIYWDGIFEAAHLHCKPISFDKAEAEMAST
jgi:hypothetical protein